MNILKLVLSILILLSLSNQVFAHSSERLALLQMRLNVLGKKVQDNQKIIDDIKQDNKKLEKQNQQLKSILKVVVKEIAATRGSLSKRLLLPVGSIIPSMLTEDGFQKIYGDGWVLADGRDVQGSKYYQLTDKAKLPDLRGKFLRGKNYNLAKGDGNAEGDLPLGYYQRDTIKKHKHKIKIFKSKWTGKRQLRIAGVKTTDKKQIGEVYLEECGEDETCPRNITVNYFIRIN